LKAAVVVGARPNFMKAAPLIREFKNRGKIEPLLVHTGQHYDRNMSRIFFEELELPKPDVYLGVGSGTHAEQTGKIMIEFEKVVFRECPDIIVVVGDVNSTMACSLVGSKTGVPIAHVEAGLRSFDRTMPEEINRMVTDCLSRYCFTTSPEAEQNLKREGVKSERIFFVGNIMIDSLYFFMERAERSSVMEEMGLKEENYILVTLHRPSNVDEPVVFSGILDALRRLSDKIPVVFPVHPRTRKTIDSMDLDIGRHSNFYLTGPIGYLDFVRLMKSSRMVITDSGGIQEETTVLGVPCLTVRNNTERPITVEIGSNKLVGQDGGRIYKQAEMILEGSKVDYKIPPLWDGKTAARIEDVLEKHIHEH
jgi:UDP-N-acetylglucosamine 2-epimerase (non-hydrolysing)